MDHPVELIAPAGNMECARAAVANGADAVYFGLQQFNARIRADNFTEQTLPELVRFLHAHHVRAFCTFNILVFTDELPAAERQLRLLDQAGVDAVLIQDLGLAQLARDLGLRFDVHASTQMTITSPEGVAFAQRLGIKRVVIARETSLRELAKFGMNLADSGTGVSPVQAERLRNQTGETPVPLSAVGPAVELETFVHGALCVAYSGQCLTSEALGQRSANRGECAQACRLPYQLLVDGALRELGDRRYLLSPQDLASVAEIPELIRLGVRGFKIEGRLKTPEYVAATCQVYRKAIDAALGSDARLAPFPARGRPAAVCGTGEGPTGQHASDMDRYKLEMTFSRGLSSGWLHGVNHQQLVHARFGTKRGPLVGRIAQVGRDHVTLGATGCALRPGDGIVFDTGGDPEHEQGGRIWEIKEDRLYFAHGHLDFARLKPGDRVWKTSDPQLTKELRHSFEGDIPLPTQRLDLTVTGRAGEPLRLSANGIELGSAMPLQVAHTRPLTTARLRDQLGRLGGTSHELGRLDNRLEGDVILPVSELNRLRRELVARLAEPGTGSAPSGTGVSPVHSSRVAPMSTCAFGHRESRHADLYSRATPEKRTGETPVPLPAASPTLTVLCRTTDQVRAALEAGCGTLYLDFEDLRRYGEAVALIRAATNAKPAVFLATPRIQKAGEQGFFRLIENARPDGVLIRNLGGLDFFRTSPLRKIGDFSLNVANPLTAELLMREGLERLTVSYDLNAQQVVDLLGQAPPAWFELVIHQHLPMFHMEHCVFAAFLTNGTDHTNCGRPCDVHNLKLRDRVGVDHPVKADVGCRNTVFHARAQSGAEFLAKFLAAGARWFRVELLEETAERSRQVLAAYRGLLTGSVADPGAVLQRLNVVRQLGVTSGTLTVLG